MRTLWDKGYEVNEKVRKFLVGDRLEVNAELTRADAIGSIAHAKMLASIGILTEEEFEKLQEGLVEIIELSERGEFQLTIEDEDIHTKIENFLTERYGEAGKRIHTARSRNDQIILDTRIYTREKLLKVEQVLLALCQALLDFSERNKDVPMPGYTHLQRAMGSSVGLWSASFLEALLDDLVLLKTAYKLNNQCPLGSAAGYGVSIPIDRQLTSDLLGFEKVQNNTLYVQNSRGKIEGIVLSALSQIMSDLSRMANDMVLFYTSEFGFFTFPDELRTGSSIMPQKKNLDVMEVVRAKAKIIFSYCGLEYSLIESLPSGYSRDTKETKKPLLEGLDLTISTLEVCELVVHQIIVNKDKLREACSPEIFAADRAYQLVREEGMPFRDAYRKVSADLNELKKMKPEEVKNLIISRDHLGAPGNLGLDKLQKQIDEERGLLEGEYDFLESKYSSLLGERISLRN